MQKRQEEIQSFPARDSFGGPSLPGPALLAAAASCSTGSQDHFQRLRRVITFSDTRSALHKLVSAGPTLLLLQSRKNMERMHYAWATRSLGGVSVRGVGVGGTYWARTKRASEDPTGTRTQQSSHSLRSGPSPLCTCNTNQHLWCY